jgi:hypothetical protein
MNTDQTSTTSTTSNEDPESLFFTIIERLKVQKALPRDSFIQQMPFFNFSSISKESQIKELFQDISDPNLYKSLIKNIITLPDDKNPDMITKRLSAMQVMGFAQIVLYKVLPCPDANCPNFPREIATHNQYKDYEYQCPFYHHEKDRRRMVITPVIDEEFIYKANYFEDGRRTFDKDKYSQNYFESMFHPLYYKMFRCKREYCNLSQFCPFYHSEEEKKTWDKVFSNFIRKDRITYVKDKQKYYEHNSHLSENRQPKPTSNQTSPNNSNNSNSLSNSPNNSNLSNHNMNHHKQNRRPKNSAYQHQVNPPYQKYNNEWRTDRGFKPNPGKKWENKKQNPPNYRKQSGGSIEENSSPINFGHFPAHKDALTYRAS